MTKIPRVLIEGYRRCRCGELVLEHVAWMTGGVCFQCFLKGEYGRVRSIEIAVRMRRMSIPTGHVPAPKKRRKGHPRTEQLATKAQTRAMKRLRHLYPDMYDIVYAEERVRGGLQPLPRRVPHGWYNEVVTTYLTALPYAAAEPGDPHGAAFQPSIEGQH